MPIVDGQDISALMVRSGLARDCPRFSQGRGQTMPALSVPELGRHLIDRPGLARFPGVGQTEDIELAVVMTIVIRFDGGDNLDGLPRRGRRRQVDLRGGAEREQSRYGTLLRLAASARAAGDPAAAVKIYQQAIALDGGRIDAHVLLGDTLVELKAFDDAANTYQDALRRQAGNVTAHRGYARAMLGLNRPESAIVHFQAVLGDSANDVQAHNGLGVAFDLAGQHEAAEAAYRAGLAVAPDSILLRNNLGLSLALAGRHQESIELLRAVVDEPGAKARNRQNLALAYGLAGDLVAAERIARLDLDEEEVQNNLAYYAALAAVDDRRQRAAALGVHPPELNDRPSDAETARRVGAIALGGRDLELGLAATGRWFVNLGSYAGAEQAASAWRQLRSQHHDVLGELSRLAGVQDGAQPLLVGPLADAERAQSLCGTLRVRGQNCRALAL